MNQASHWPSLQRDVYCMQAPLQSISLQGPCSMKLECWRVHHTCWACKADELTSCRQMVCNFIAGFMHLAPCECHTGARGLASPVCKNFVSACKQDAWLEEHTVTVASSRSRCHTMTDDLRNSLRLIGRPFTQQEPRIAPPLMLHAKILSCRK